MKGGYIFPVIFVFQMLHRSSTPLDRCGVPKLCWCMSGRIACVGETVYTFPSFPEPLLRTTRTLSIDSTRIRYLANFKLDKWVSLSHLVIVGNIELVNCPKVLETVKIQAERLGVIAHCSCPGHTPPTTQTYTKTTDTSTYTYTSTYTSTSQLTSLITSISNISTYGTYSPIIQTDWTTLHVDTSTEGGRVGGHNLAVIPVLIIMGIGVGVLVSSCIPVLVIYIIIKKKQKALVVKKHTPSAIYIPTIETSQV